MTKVQQTHRFVRVLFYVVLYMAHAILVRALIREPWQQKQKLIAMISRYSARGLGVLGIDVVVKGDLASAQENNFLIVSNHLSYLDILVLSSRFPSCFVTSVEIRETRFLGQLTALAGCLFVERRNKKNLMQEVRELTGALKKGLNVTVFPEATSTNGDQVLRFRRPLFHAALAAQRPVLPICLNYRRIGNEPVTRANRDSLFWYGDMPFLSHLWQVAACGKIQVQLDLLDTLYGEESHEAGDLAAISQSRVENVYQPMA